VRSVYVLDLDQRHGKYSQRSMKTEKTTDTASWMLLITQGAIYTDRSEPAFRRLGPALGDDALDLLSGKNVYAI